jgi:uncharacterized membrane protein YcaP (DUF421 family)
MDTFFNVNWKGVFVPSIPIVEIVVRGSLVYLAIFALLRSTMKRRSGAIGITDLLVVVFIADAAQNAMAINYTSITDGIILVTTIVFWSYILNWLEHRLPNFHGLVYSPPILLVKDGCILHHNLQKELISEDVLMSQLRQLGVNDVAEVKESYLESNGSISGLVQGSKNIASTASRTASV